MTGTLRPFLTKRLGNGVKDAPAQTLFRRVINAGATLEIKPAKPWSHSDGANDPLLIVAGHAEQRQQIPWPALACRGSGSSEDEDVSEYSRVRLRG